MDKSSIMNNENKMHIEIDKEYLKKAGSPQPENKREHMKNLLGYNLHQTDLENYGSFKGHKIDSCPITSRGQDS